MLDFGALPPEINSGLMYAGPGSGPMMAAAAAWDGLAAELATAASGYGSVISELTSAPWMGPSSRAMVAAVTPYVTWLSAMAGQAEETASQARACRGRLRDRVHDDGAPAGDRGQPGVVGDADRDQFPGQNTPAIAATEAQYMEMWAQDAGAMYGYSASSALDLNLAPLPVTAEHHQPGRTDQPGPRGDPSHRTAGGQLRTERAASTTTAATSQAAPQRRPRHAAAILPWLRRDQRCSVRRLPHPDQPRGRDPALYNTI